MIPIELTQEQLDVLLADVTLQLARYGYKSSSGFDPSASDAAKYIDSGSLYGVLQELRELTEPGLEV